MFDWLIHLFARKPYRTAPPWETPDDVRIKLRCAAVGIDPTTVQEPQDHKVSKVG
jgi:hypothetical protein